MIEFDHERLTQRLSTLPHRLRSLFAAMVAERFLPHGAPFLGKSGQGTGNSLADALDLLWRYGSGESLAKAELDRALDASMFAINAAAPAAGKVIPLTGAQRRMAERMGAKPTKLRDIAGNHEDSSAAFFAESAASAVAYGLRSALSDDPKEAAWAGQSGYDAVDRFVLLEESNNDRPWTEAQIGSHPVIQQELERQIRDIEVLAGLLANSPELGKQVSKLREAARAQARTVFAAHGT